MPSQLHSELCLRGAKFLRNNGFAVTFDDRFQATTSSGENPDVIGFRNGVSCLIEVKVSRADFIADQKKRFRLDPSLGMGDWRFYLSPPDIIMPEDLPKGWGLLHAHNKVIKKVVGFPPNTKWRAKPFVADKQNEVDFLYSALRKLSLNVSLDDILSKLK